MRIIEIQSQLTDPKAQLTGYGKALIEFVFAYYPNRKRIFVGTADVPSTLGF